MIRVKKERTQPRIKRFFLSLLYVAITNEQVDITRDKDIQHCPNTRHAFHSTIDVIPNVFYPSFTQSWKFEERGYLT